MSCEHLDRMAELALTGLPSDEARALEVHAADCPTCREELMSLRATVDSFGAWPADVLQPQQALWGRLAKRLGNGADGGPAREGAGSWTEPDWVQVAPGISCKFLALDGDRDLVSMLVRLAPNAAYPPHTHVAHEELHLLDGQLWINDRKLDPGDYYRAEPGSSDTRVWSVTGCTCVLVTSTLDVLR